MRSIKILVILILVLLSINVTKASDKYTSLSSSFAGLGFSVFDRVEPELSSLIKFPDKVIVKDRFSMILTSSLVDWKDLHNRVFVICDWEFEIDGVYCNSSVVRSDKSNYVYQFESDNQIYKIFNVRYEEKELYIIPESYFLESKKRSQLNEYLTQLYEIEQIKVSNNIGIQTPTRVFLEIEDSLNRPLLYAVSTVLFILFLVLVVKTFFTKKYHVLLLFGLVLVFWIYFSLSVYTKFVSKDLSNYADFLIDVLRISSPLQYLLEDKTWISILSFGTLLIFTLIILIILKKTYSEILFNKIFVNYNFSYFLFFLLSSLFVLVDTKYFLAIGICALYFGYYSRQINNIKVLKICMFGVITGLIINLAILFFNNNYKTKILPDNLKFIVTPYETLLPGGKLLKQYISTNDPVFINDYLVFYDGLTNILNHKLSDFAPKPSYLIYSGEKYENTINMIMNNQFLINELKQDKFSPFLVIKINDLRYDSNFVFKIRMKCKYSSGYNINFKPYYFDNISKSLRTDASRINLLDFMGCSAGREIEEFHLTVTPDRFRSGINLLRFNTGSTDIIENVKIIIDDVTVETKYITNLYDHGIIYSNLSANAKDLYFYSSEISNPLTVGDGNEMKNLEISTIINLMKINGLIQDKVRIQSTDYGKALYYE